MLVFLRTNTSALAYAEDLLHPLRFFLCGYLVSRKYVAATPLDPLACAPLGDAGSLRERRSLTCPAGVRPGGHRVRMGSVPYTRTGLPRIIYPERVISSKSTDNDGSVNLIT